MADHDLPYQNNLEKASGQVLRVLFHIKKEVSRWRRKVKVLNGLRPKAC